MKFVLMLGLIFSQMASAAPTKRVLVILFSEDKITVLKDRKTGELTTHPTGFFLSELMVPLTALIDAGYEPVYASPKGGFAIMDKVSDSFFWFGGSEKEYCAVRELCEREGLCGEGLIGSQRLKRISDVIADGVDSYAGVLVPGGHAPMEDLWKDKNLRKILRSFHESARPTALICHGPIALLSAMNSPAAFADALQKGKSEEAATLAKDWICRGYQMTAFSTKEEQQEEPGQDNVLGGWVKFYPDEALDIAGGKVLVRAQKWQSNVVRDRELITGQNPFSDQAFARTFVSALNEGKKGQ